MTDINIIPYKNEYKQDFIRLNLAWIEKYFRVEPQDVEMLEKVEDLIADGAAVYFAETQGNIIAVCMVVPRSNQVWEICKLAADERYSGRGAGSAVLDACIEYAKKNGAQTLMIVSNTVLSAAMHLYTKFGFKEVPISNQEYERVNIQLEREL